MVPKKSVLEIMSESAPSLQNSIVVIGAGHAGTQLAIFLRQGGYEGRIVIVGDEPGEPYQRPPLSKDYLAGRIERAALTFRPSAFFQSKRIELLQGEVVEIDRGRQTARLADGTRIAYSSLVLAPGASNRTLRVPGAELEGVLPLRTVADADALRSALATASRAVVIGAGFIGLEFATTALNAGLRVDVIDVASRLMARAVSAATSAAFMEIYKCAGTQFHLECGVDEIVNERGKVAGVRLSDGALIPADIVVYGIGVVPRTGLAASAGLAVGEGIRVDEMLRTTDPAIYAIGDAAEFPFEGGRFRLESVQNATDQARCVAAALVGRPTPYSTVPWFWSDQLLRLQIAGLARDCDEHVVIGESSQQFSVGCFRKGQLVAVESVNRPADHIAARKILAGAHRPLSSEFRQAGFELKSWAREPASLTAARVQ